MTDITLHPRSPWSSTFHFFGHFNPVSRPCLSVFFRISKLPLPCRGHFFVILLFNQIIFHSGDITRPCPLLCLNFLMLSHCTLVRYLVSLTGKIPLNSMFTLNQSMDCLFCSHWKDRLVEDL